MMKTSVIRKACVSFAILGTAFGSSPENKLAWIDDTFEDFSAGTLDASGQNLYVAHDGSVRAIHRYDLNDDGYLDLFFGNTHDDVFQVPPTLARLGKGGVASQSALPVPGADSMAVGDLNKDGETDLVFTLTNDGLQSSWRKVWILYGSAEGWTARRATGALPVQNPLGVAIADLDADGWPDIAVINKPYSTTDKLPSTFLRVFWGAETGFSLSRFSDIPCPDLRTITAFSLDGKKPGGAAALAVDGTTLIYLPGDKEDPRNLKAVERKSPLKEASHLGLVSADFDRDGHADLVVTTDQDMALMIRGAAGNSFAEPKTFAAFPASKATAGDLDEDGFPDLVLTFITRGTAGLASSAPADDSSPENFQVMWGGAKGFSREDALSLPAKYASSSAIGDFDGDGFSDIGVAIYQGKRTYDAQSLVYLGRGERRFELSPHTISTTGASAMAAVPAPNASDALVICNRVRATLSEQVPFYVYWGGKAGFSAERRLEIAGQSSHMAAAADLNADGHTDLLVTFTAHGGEVALANPVVGVNIFWGSADGFDEDRRTVLPTPWMDSVNVADLNRDGWLDIVTGGWHPWVGKDNGKPSDVRIFYGGPTGFSDKPVVLECPGRSNGALIADFDGDGWLDIAATSFGRDRVRIFHGSAEGFSSKNVSLLAVDGPIAIETADLNGDGLLDLIVGRYMDKANELRNAGSLIFWGSVKGFREWDSQWLPGLTPLPPTVADFDGDGFLDIFSPSYHDQNRREHIPSFLFWGGANGFDPQNRTDITTDSASGSFAGDFNGDGLMDLAISCHTKEGNHQTNSLVLYNDGRRFEKPEIQALPTLGSHFMFSRNMGNISDRSFRQHYVSAIRALPEATTLCRLTHEADVPPGSALEFSFRSAPTPETLATTEWKEAEKEAFRPKPDDKYLQYRAVFRSPNGDVYPTLRKVAVSFE